MALAITQDNFDLEVMQEEKPVLLDFWAEWCPPCKMIAPIIDELAEEYKDKIKVVKVDVDSAGKIAQQYSVSSIPTLILMNKGEVVKQQVGALPKPSIIELFQDYL